MTDELNPAPAAVDPAVKPDPIAAAPAGIVAAAEAVVSRDLNEVVAALEADLAYLRSVFAWPEKP